MSYSPVLFASPFGSLGRSSVVDGSGAEGGGEARPPSRVEWLMGRTIAVGLRSVAQAYVWGVQYTGSSLYASDMVNGLWKLQAFSR